MGIPRGHSVGLAILACYVIAVVLVSAERRGPRPLRPEVPTVEEQRRILTEAGRHPDPRRWLPPPLARLHLGDDFPRYQAQKRNTVQKSRLHLKAARDPTLREPQPDIAGRVDPSSFGEGRITNGSKAVIGQFPWQVGILQYVGWSEEWCGGSLVSSQWVLTAAHCVDDGATQYHLTVGTVKSSKGTEPSMQTAVATEYHQHDEYSPYFIDNDIALIKSPKHFVLTAWVRPVRLPPYSYATDMMVGKRAKVSGWGLTTDKDSWITDDLMWTYNTISDGTACYNAYGNAWIPNKICTETLDYKSICSGDSGGALVYEEEPNVWTQIGIVSFGASDGCSKQLPTAFTRVATFLEYIEDVTNIAIRE